MKYKVEVSSNSMVEKFEKKTFYIISLITLKNIHKTSNNNI